MKIYGAVDARDTLEPQLIWATPSNRGFPPQRADGSREIPGLSSIPRTQRYASGGSDFDDEFPSLRGKKKTTPAQLDALEKADELRSILNNLEKVDDGSRRESLMDKLCPTADVLNLPDHPHPPGIESGDLIVDLLKHQVCVQSIVMHRIFIMIWISSVKHYSGVSTTSIRNSQRQILINPCSFGN